MDLAVLVPVLKRPHRVAPTLKAFNDTVPGARVLFIADSNDEEELAAIDVMAAECLALDPPVTWAKKINAGYHATSEPFFFLGADDIVPHEGWYEKALEKMKPGIGIVGTNDLSNPRTIQGVHSTHSLIRRAYIQERSGTMDTQNTVVCEEYPHEYADDELVQTAMFRNAYAHAHESIVEHMHPIVGGAWHPNGRPSLPDDDTYRLGRSQTRLGRYIYRHRQLMWT